LLLAPFLFPVSAMTLTRQSGCKINLLLNVLRRREDGFHELETLMQPVGLFDELTFSTEGADHLKFACSDATLPTGDGNLVVRAARAFFAAAGIAEQASVYLEKRIPAEAGLGGGSGNAAATLLGLNELFDFPLTSDTLDGLARELGSDVPFFLEDRPALAVGRGEQVERLDPFPALEGKWLFLARPGFGVSTPFAYEALKDHPEALNGRPGRARELARALGQENLAAAANQFYNSLEAPVLRKFPVLSLFQEFLLENGALVALMSGSGSTTFAIAGAGDIAESWREKFRSKFGASNWTAALPL